MKEFTTEELRGHGTWSTHLMQVYVNEGLLGSGGDGSGGPPKTSTTDNVSTGKRTNEQCCVMTNRKKWNFHKKPLVGFCHSPTQGVRHSINLHDPKYFWIGDSGTSCHLTNTDQGMVSWTPIHEEINLGDGTPIYATKQGTMRFEVHQRNGKRAMSPYMTASTLNIYHRACSVSPRHLAKGWKLSNRGVHIVLTNGTSRIEFDRVNPTTTGCIMTVQMVPLVPTVEKSNSMTTRTKSNCTYCTKPTHLTKSDSSEVLAPNPTPYIHSTKMLKDMGNKLKSNQKLSTPKQKVQKTENRRSVATSTNTAAPTATWELVVRNKNKNFTKSPPNSSTLDINYYHQVLGHVNEKFLRDTARHYGITLTGTLNSCVACSLAKIHNNPIPTSTKPRSEIPGERIFIDISHFPQPSIAGNRYWLLIVDDATDMAWSVFLKKKSDLPERMINFLYNMRNNGTPVENIRLDNSGENNDLREQTNKLFMGIRYEFTAPNTPQQNGRVERKFSILYEYMRSILNAAKLTQPLRQLLWAEAANHSTDVINGICTSTNPIPPYRAFYNKDPSYFKYLRPFGELSVIASNNKLKSKMSDRGFLGLYLGREPYHTNDTYRFLNLSSHRVLLSRNVKFMNQMYGDYIPPFPDHHNNRYSVLYIDDDDDDDEEPTTYLPSTPVPATIPTLPHVGTNPTNPSPDDADDDEMPELVPDTPSDLQSDPYDPFDNVDDDEFDFLPPPAPTPKPISTRLQRELRKLDGHLDYFKHSSKWSNQHAPRAGGESRPYPIENNTEPIIEEIENDDENEIVPRMKTMKKKLFPLKALLKMKFSTMKKIMRN